MAWDIQDELVGREVMIYTANGESEGAVVIAVSTVTGNLKVRALEDGEIMIGGEWEPID